MTQDQRNAVMRLIRAAETVIDDYQRGDLTHTRFAVESMAKEIKFLRQPENREALTAEEFSGGGK